MHPMTQNGRAATEVTTPPVVADTRVSTHPATPEYSVLALVREADENATDGDMDRVVSYRIRWNAFLAQDGAA